MKMLREEEKKREDNVAKLRKMMDSDDDEDKTIYWNDSDAEQADGTSVVKVEEEAADKAEPEQDVQQVKGRRRGARKVIKKRTMKDEDGYLVTKEVSVWESFSESEPELRRAAKNTKKTNRSLEVADLAYNTESGQTSDANPNQNQNLAPLIESQNKVTNAMARQLQLPTPPTSARQ